MDPRTKILLLFVVNMLVMTYPSTLLLGIVLFLNLLLMMTIGWKYVVVVAVSFVVVESLYLFLPSHLPAWLGAIVLGMFFWIARFILAGSLGYYVIVTTRPGEVVAALRRMRCPNSLVTVITVMMRFIPVLLNEVIAIMDAMKLRGIAPTGGSALLHPIQTSEFIVVPLLSSTSRLSDDLAASGVIRGLGTTKKPTCITWIGFGWADLMAVLITAGLVVVVWLDWSIMIWGRAL